MQRALTLLAVAAFAGSLATGADAKACRDAKGKFVACPAAAAAPAGKCRDKKTKKFVSCSAPNSEPVPKK